MPNVMDLVKEARKTRRGSAFALKMEQSSALMFAEEIKRMTATDAQKAAHAELLPDLEQICTQDEVEALAATARWKEFNRKARKWIDSRRGLGTP